MSVIDPKQTSTEPQILSARAYTEANSTVVPHEFTFRPVGIANPCVFDKPLMPHLAVWTVGAAEKYRGAAEEPRFDVSARGDYLACLRATNH
jgi:hypothetical protein